MYNEPPPQIETEAMRKRRLARSSDGMDNYRGSANAGYRMPTPNIASNQADWKGQIGTLGLQQKQLQIQQGFNRPTGQLETYGLQQNQDARGMRIENSPMSWLEFIRSLSLGAR